MASTIESKGVSTTVAQPTDISSLHTKDVGEIKKGNLDNFVATYNQPPLSRFFATVTDTNKVENCPDIRKIDYEPIKNAAFSRGLKFASENFGDSIKDTKLEGRTLNSFDCKVLLEAMKLVKYMVSKKLDESLEIYSQVDSHFSRTWEGERNNAT